VIIPWSERTSVHRTSWCIANGDVVGVYSEQSSHRSQTLSDESTVQSQMAVAVGQTQPGPRTTTERAANGYNVVDASRSSKTGLLFARLIRTARAYLPQAGIELIERAYARACIAHQGQERDSGEPYINHCIETAQILADFRLDAVPIAAAILHDVLEDTATTSEDVRAEFGDDVARLGRKPPQAVPCDGRRHSSRADQAGRPRS